MKKTQNNYRADYSIAIKTLGYSIDEIESIKETSINEELERQLERENKSAAEYPESYRLADIMNSAGGNNYRSGCDIAGPYMTHEDFVRLIVAETKIGSYGKNPARVSREAVRPAAVYNVRSLLSASESAVCSGYESVISGGGHYVARVEGSDTTIGGGAARMIDRWFPACTVVRPDRKVRRRLASSAAGIAWVLIFALIVALPIALGVIKSEASAELISKREDLAALEDREAQLIAELESSIDLREVERIAISDYGMIKLEQSTLRVLRLGGADSIESFSDTKSNSLVPALLSALGIRSGNE